VALVLKMVTDQGEQRVSPKWFYLGVFEAWFATFILIACYVQLPDLVSLGLRDAPKGFPALTHCKFENWSAHNHSNTTAVVSNTTAVVVWPGVAVAPWANRTAGVVEPAGPLVGFCIVGHVRSFSYAPIQEDLLTKLVQAMAGENFRSFVLLTLQDSPRQGAAVDSEPLSSALLQAFHTVTAGFYNGNGSLHSVWGEPWHGYQWNRFAVQNNTACRFTRKRPNSRWQEQWMKVQRCYQMLRDFERGPRGLRFAYVVRLRPDVLILRPARHVSEMKIGPGEIGIPKGIVYTSGLNDHLAVCRGSTACGAYFNIFDRYTKCNGTLDFGNDSGNMFLASVLKKQHVKVRLFVLIYTLFRSCPEGAAMSCARLKTLNKIGVRHMNTCKEMSAHFCRRVAAQALPRPSAR